MTLVRVSAVDAAGRMAARVEVVVRLVAGARPTDPGHVIPTGSSITELGRRRTNADGVLVLDLVANVDIAPRDDTDPGRPVALTYYDITAGSSRRTIVVPAGPAPGSDDGVWEWTDPQLGVASPPPPFAPDAQVSAQRAEAARDAAEGHAGTAEAAATGAAGSADDAAGSASAASDAADTAAGHAVDAGTARTGAETARDQAQAAAAGISLQTVSVVAGGATLTPALDVWHVVTLGQAMTVSNPVVPADGKNHWVALEVVNAGAFPFTLPAWQWDGGVAPSFGGRAVLLVRHRNGATPLAFLAGTAMA